MIVNVGSSNPVKVDAVREAIGDYDIFSGAEVRGIESQSGVSEQPTTIDEMCQGAITRARNAFSECDYSFGIESGLMVASHANSGFIEASVCAVYDGKNHYLGLSPGFELPSKVIKLIMEEKIDLNEAVYKVGLSKNPRVGSEGGIVSVLTKGRIDRKTYTKYAVIMALSQIENKSSYTGQ